MRDLVRGRILIIALAPALILLGCTSASKKEDQAKQIKDFEPRIGREYMLQAAWRGLPYHALLQAFGPPHIVLSIPGYRPLKTNIVVYGIRDGASNCIDAFTIVTPSNNTEEIVADYFCR